MSILSKIVDFYNTVEVNEKENIEKMKKEITEFTSKSDINLIKQIVSIHPDALTNGSLKKALNGIFSLSVHTKIFDTTMEEHNYKVYEGVLKWNKN